MPVKKKSPSFVTPKGRVGPFPCITRPDAKYEIYKVVLLFDPTAPGVQTFLDTIEAKEDEAVKEQLAAMTPIARKGANQNHLIKDELDPDTAEPTGFKAVTFTMKPFYKDDAGNMVPRKPGLMDSKGNPVKGEPRIAAGTTAKVEYSALGYTSGKNIGLKLYLKNIQILDLVEWGARSAFGVEDGGYTVGEDKDDDGDDSVLPNAAKAKGDF